MLTLDRIGDETLFAAYARLEALAATCGDQPGRAEVLGWDLEYTAPAALLTFLDYICFRRINDFLPDSERPVILDCGANIGYTVLHYKRQYPHARITAFEPDPQFAPVLRRNLQRNGLGDVEVVEAAAWTNDGTARWLMEGTDGSRLLRGESDGQVADVRTVDLCRFLDEPIDLLKIDIEGAEFELVPHVAAKLRNVKNVLIECHISEQPQWDAFARLLTTLREAGFRVSLNSYGPWRDLTRRHEAPPLHAEQYVLVSGWRAESALVSREQTFLPYVGVAHYREVHQRERERAREAETAAESAQLRDVVLDLVTGRGAWASHQLQRPFARESGQCWSGRLPDSVTPGDTVDASGSPLLLLEDDRMLGPAHAPHAAIRADGGGRYSHWHTALLFSSSDGSDPNTNGRTYVAVFRR